MLEGNPHALLMGHYYGEEAPLIRSAAVGGQAAAAALLLQLAPASATVRDDCQELALHRAARSSHSDVVAVLLQAAPEAAMCQSWDRRNPLILAAGSGSIETVQLLLQNSTGGRHRARGRGSSAAGSRPGRAHRCHEGNSGL